MLKRPLVLYVFAVVAFLYAGQSMWAAGRIIADGAAHWSAGLLLELVWVAFNVFLGVGILRLQATARVAALFSCWMVFIGVALVVLLRFLAPPRVPLLMLLGAGALFALFFWFHWQLRQPAIRALFTSRPAATPSI